MLTTPFTELLGCRLPLQQAPMGGVTTPELVAAVAGAGAVGMVPAQMLPAEALGALASWQAGSAAESFQGEVVGETRMGSMTLPVPRFGVPCPNRETTGAIEAMVHYAGQSVAATSQVRPAAEVVTELAEGAEQLLRRWG